MQTVKEEKNRLRKSCKALRREMPPQQRKASDNAVFYRTSEIVRHIAMQMYTYVSSPGIEVDTLRLIDFALEKGMTVIVPKCVPADCTLEHYIIKSRAQLKSGFYGIMEPDPLLCTKSNEPMTGVCIVPGLAFDAAGHRLGYGKGYYDRFLEGFRGIKIGLCYDCCFFSGDIPFEPFDAVMDMVITESGVHRTSGQG